VSFLLFKKTFYAIIKKYYYTVFQLKKEFNKSCLVLYICFILVTWSLLQISLQTFFENNDNRLMKIPSIYAQDDGSVNGNGGGDGDGGVFDDNGGRDVEELGLDKENIPDEDIGQEDDPEQLTLSEDGRSEIQALIQQDANDVIEELTLEDSQDEYVDISIFDGGALSGTNINSQQPPGDRLSPLFVSLPLPPAGPLPPGGLPPIPGSPLPPGSPIPPGGGPTPPEYLPPDEVHHDDDDDENKDDDDDEEKEDEDEDNDDKDNS
jgi:hypothetical protein